MTATSQSIGKAVALSIAMPKGQNHLPTKLHGDQFVAFMVGKYIALKRAEMLEARWTTNAAERARHVLSARKHSREAVSYLRLIEKAGR